MTLSLSEALFSQKFYLMKWISVLLVLFMVACSTEPASPLETLENEVAESPTNENVTELLKMYDTWLDENPATSEERKEVLLKASAVSNKHLRYAALIPILRELIVEYPNDPQTVDRMIEFANVQESLGRDRTYLILLKLLARNHAGKPQVEALYPKIGGNPAEPDTLLAELGSDMFDRQTMRVNHAAAREYIGACEGYALIEPRNPNVVDNLHKAAETARTLGAIDKSLDIYDWVLEQYPNHKRAPQALFLKAFTYDSNLKDFDNARKYYLEFLEKYPDDQFAPSAQFLLDNLGKDDEELLKSLQEKAGSQDEPTK